MKCANGLSKITENQQFVVADKEIHWNRFVAYFAKRWHFCFLTIFSVNQTKMFWC